MTAYAELAVTTNFSFLRGASHPQEMVATAEALGLAAIGIADRNSFAGVVRAFDEWKKHKTVKLLVGTRLVTTDGFEVLAYPTDRARLRPALPPADAGQHQDQERAEGRMPPHLRGHPGGERRPDADRPAAGRRSRPPSPSGSQRSPAQRRDAPFSPASIAIAATSRAGSGCSTSSASARGAPLVAVNDVHLPRAGAAAARRRASPASARSAPSPRPASGWRPMPSGI